MAGGYSPASVRSKDVVKAAAKAIELINARKIKAELKAYKAAGYPSFAAAKAANATGMLDGWTLRILKVDKAEKQVVAGKQVRPRGRESRVPKRSRTEGISLLRSLCACLHWFPCRASL